MVCLSTSLHGLCVHQLQQHTVSQRLSNEALQKIELCLTTFLKEVGRNLAKILDKTCQVTVSADYVLLYAEVGLHLSSAQLDQLSQAMLQQPQKTEKRVSKSKQFGLMLSMKRVIELIEAGMQEQLSQKYSYSLPARVGCTWIAEQVTRHFVLDSLNYTDGKSVRGTDVANNWLHRYIGAQEP